MNDWGSLEDFTAPYLRANTCPPSFDLNDIFLLHFSQLHSVIVPSAQPVANSIVALLTATAVIPWSFISHVGLA